MTSVSLEPRSRSEAAVESLRSTNETRGMRSVTDGRAVPMGIPRYVKGIEPTEQLNTCAKRKVKSAAVLRVISVDFSMLIRKPTEDV